MTAGPATDSRSIRAAGIVQSGNIIEVRPGIFHVRDTVSGSGQWHLTSEHGCGCRDAQRHPGLECKHQKALKLWKAQQTACPTCGSATRVEAYHVGGRGQCWFRICTADKYHTATRLN